MENTELLKSFCSDIQNGHHGSYLETVQTWWEPFGRHRDSELLKSVHSDIHSWIEPKFNGRHCSDIEIKNC